jgi:hypothetical protein
MPNQSRARENEGAITNRFHAALRRLHGQFRPADPFPSLSIADGTGGYAGARGTVKVGAVGMTADLTITYTRSGVGIRGRAQAGSLAPATVLVVGVARRRRYIRIAP